MSDDSPHFKCDRAELEARNARPDLFVLADDLIEAEMFRTGLLVDAA